MRNLGIFSPVAINIQALAELGISLGGIPIDNSMQQFGEIPSAAYLDLATDLSNGCFDDYEFHQLQSQLGFPPAAYVSIHMGSTQAAFARAFRIAEAILERWGGSIDYSGAGARISDPFRMPANLASQME
jgi:hypothetical protein